MIFQKFTYPWQYVIVDDFLPEDLFRLVQQQGQKMILAGDWGVHEFVEQHYPYDLTGCSTDSVISAFMGFKHYLTSIAKWNILEQFDQVRPHDYDLLDALGEIHVHQPGYQYPVHDERSSKIISMVTYISEDTNCGTQLHETKHGPAVVEVEWRPNRCLIMAGQTGVTWHSYQANHNPRVSMNYFFIENHH